ncbi:MAG TPA: protein-methionine-sulfoxide reductase heme-binding subunit MsrQ [Gemmatimonadales bacterium]|nr:protein-methionine-sulfoxide reductase heme-binding subunit MsrQ [Gemmatimonadales bacterium]
MTDAQLIRRVIKPALWILGLAPLVYLVNRIRVGDLGFDPIRTVTHFTGRTAIIILFITLTVTPMRRITGWNPLIKVRRLIGLFAFFYATIHFLIYAVFDRELSLAGLGEDIAKRPWITVGFTVFLILLTLAITSPQAMVRRLGKRWQSLHRLIYVAAGLAVLHFTWAQKKDIRLPLIYAAVLAVILASRLVLRPRNVRREM